MLLDLAKLSIAGLKLSLAREGHLEDRLSVRNGENISGRLLTDQSGVRLEEVLSTALSLDALLLTFGKVTLEALTGAAFEHMRTELRLQHGEASGSIFAQHTRATQLEVRVGALVIRAELEAQSLTLELVGSAGQVRAEKATFRGLHVQSGELSITSPALDVENLTIGWGDPQFRIDCDAARAEECAFKRDAWSARASGLELSQVHVRGSEVSVDRVRFAHVEGSAEFAHGRPSEPRPQATTPKLPLWDMALLDRLAGNLIADIEVDLSVPILGRRRATHELRVPVENGSLDYITLEKGLSRLEDSLLDFAVRDGGLALELGLPLIGSRGRGKPILIWDLSPEDYRLAEQKRVRLAVLPKLRLASARQSEPPPPESGANPSRFSLRSLSVANVHTDLSLGPRPLPMSAMLSELVFQSLHLQGTVHHDPEAPSRAGLLRTDADRVTATLQALPLGTSELGLTLRLGRLEDASLRFDDIRLRHVSCALTELSLESVRLSHRVEA